MIFSEEAKPYLNGKVFCDDLLVRYVYDQNDFVYKSRFEILTSACRDKKVIHFGCVDHDVETIRRKLKSGTWLHKELSDVASRCYGIDIEERGVAYMRDQLNYRDVKAINIIEQDDAELLNENWDYVLLPEILEHIGNPLNFLSTLHNKLKGRVERIIITVPHAFYRGNFKHTTKGVERINSDHRFWFTAFTLCKLMTDAGYQVERVLFANSGPVRSKHRLHNWYYAKYPMKRNSLVAFGEL